MLHKVSSIQNVLQLKYFLHELDNWRILSFDDFPTAFHQEYHHSQEFNNSILYKVTVNGSKKAQYKT